MGAPPSSVDARCQDPQLRKVTPLSVTVTVDNVTPLPPLLCLRPFTVFFLIRCGAEHGYFGTAVFVVIITGMNDGARWHKVYARGDPFQADDDGYGSAHHSPPKAVL